MAIVNQCVTSIEDKNMIHFIVNEHSRSGKGVRVWRQIEALLKKEEEPYRIWRTEYVGHATKLAKEISNLDEKEIKLVVVGGDGTINEVVNGIADFGKIRFGIIPTGSGNDCARGLGISGKPEELLLRILESNGTQSIDLGKVSWKENDRINSRVFMISSGVGMDALVCKKAMTSRIKKVLKFVRHLSKSIFDASAILYNKKLLYKSLCTNSVPINLTLSLRSDFVASFVI